MRYYYEARAERSMTSVEYAKGRLAEWGVIIQQISHFGAPNPNYYSKSTFTPGAPDHGAALEFGERGDRALEVDGCVRILQDTSLEAWMAIVIHYLLSQPGKRSRLRLKDRVRLFHQATGKRRQSFYNALSAGEVWVSRELSMGRLRPLEK